MKMVILGAGASFDSLSSLNKTQTEFENWKPPLGNGLFDSRKEFFDILNSYPGAKALSNKLLVSNDIEDEIQNLWDYSIEYNDLEIISKLINLQFYLQNLMFNISNNYFDKGVSNYYSLLEKAHQY